MSTTRRTSTRRGVRGAPRVVARHSASFSDMELYEAAQRRAKELGMGMANYLEYAVARDLGREVEPHKPAQEMLTLDTDTDTTAAA